MSPVDKLARGIMNAIVLGFVLGSALGIVEHYAGHIFGADDTDAANERSYLSLRTDFGTGCQYLVTLFGGITPRLGIDGRQICKAAR